MRKNCDPQLEAMTHSALHENNGVTLVHVAVAAAIVLAAAAENAATRARRRVGVLHTHTHDSQQTH